MILNLSLSNAWTIDTLNLHKTYTGLIPNVSINNSIIEYFTKKISKEYRFDKSTVTIIPRYKHNEKFQQLNSITIFAYVLDRTDDHYGAIITYIDRSEMKY